MVDGKALHFTLQAFTVVEDAISFRPQVFDLAFFL
jgi:hypothetical protein